MISKPKNVSGSLRRFGKSIREIGVQWRKNWRNHVIVGAIGIFLALAGAFGTQSAPLIHRMIFWVSLMIAGSLCVGFILIATSKRPRIGQSRFVFWIFITLLTALPMSLLAWMLSSSLFGANAPSTFGVYLWVSTLISGLVITLMMLLNTPGLATEGLSEKTGTMAIRFMARLPENLEGAVIYSLKAEDHYLNIHTSKGSALILSRLSDAISELEGIEGAQVHRSWWVARDAITGVHRTRNAVSLELKGDVIAPVSRSNVKALQASGWI